MASVMHQDYEPVALDRLTPHPENPRKGDLDALADSIAANDFYGAVIVQRSTGFILAGNHRFLAAKGKGLVELPVIWVDVDDDRARRILLVDDRSADLATNDETLLADILGELALTDAGLIGTGYTADDLAELADDAGREVREVPAPPTPRDPVTRVGMCDSSAATVSCAATPAMTTPGSGCCERVSGWRVCGRTRRTGCPTSGRPMGRSRSRTRSGLIGF